MGAMAMASVTLCREPSWAGFEACSAGIADEDRVLTGTDVVRTLEGAAGDGCVTDCGLIAERSGTEDEAGAEEDVAGPPEGEGARAEVDLGSLADRASKALTLVKSASGSIRRIRSM
jgi:hypothetical protein